MKEMVLDALGIVTVDDGVVGGCGCGVVLKRRPSVVRVGDDLRERRAVLLG